METQETDEISKTEHGTQSKTATTEKSTDEARKETGDAQENTDTAKKEKSTKCESLQFEEFLALFDEVDESGGTSTNDSSGECLADSFTADETNDRNIRVEQVDKIDIRTHDDKEIPKISCIEMVTPDIMLLADFANNTVKSYSFKLRRVYRRHQLPAKPFGLTYGLQDYGAAVTLPEKRQIVKYCLALDGDLLPCDVITVKNKCFGIACYDKTTLIVTFSGFVGFYTLDGTFLKSVSHNGDMRIFYKPLNIAIVDSHIYVTDFRAVVKLTTEGRFVNRIVLFNFIDAVTPLTPRHFAIATDDYGIRIMREDGTKPMKQINVFQQDLDFIDVAFCPEKKLLYAMNGKGHNQGNYLCVFKIYGVPGI